LRARGAFADKHKIIWAGHGHDNVKDPEGFPRQELRNDSRLQQVIGVNLDIGHFTAAGFDAVST